MNGEDERSTKEGYLRPVNVALVTFALVLSMSLSAYGERPSPPGKARHVILFVGDGLGPAQIALGLSYARVIEGRKLALEELMERASMGVTLNFTHDTVVTDSAASASQMATGELTQSEMLSLDAEGHSRETIVEWAERRGMATGLVTNTRLTHATPAAFATHQISRYVDEQDIAQDIVGSNDIEVLLGGGARAFIPQGTSVRDSLPGVPVELDGRSRRKDDVSLIEVAKRRGYSIADDRESLLKAKSRSDKVFGLFADSHLPYDIDRSSGALDQVPTLDLLTETALEVLERSGRGFFVVVEGGRIDHAGHDNDAGTMLREILAFDKALEVGMRFQTRHPETLIIVTADHATGGFAFTYSWRSEPLEVVLPSGDKYLRRWYYPGKTELEILGRQTSSFEAILNKAGKESERLMEEVKRGTGLVLTPAEARETLFRDTEGHAVPHDFKEFYADYESAPQAMLGRALARQTSVVWSSGGHTSDPMLTFGIGPGSEGLRGVYLNTRIYEVVKKALEAGNQEFKKSGIQE